MPGREEHGLRALPFAGQFPPDLLGGERQHRGEPPNHRLRNVVHRGLRRSARHAVAWRCVQAVLQHIHVEAAQIDDAEIVDGLVNAVERVLAISVQHLCLNLRRAHQRPAIEGEHVLRLHHMPFGIEPMQIAKQKAHSVAHSAIRVRHALENLVRNADLIGIVRRRHPQAQHVRAERAHDLLRSDDVAQRFRHLAALLVHGEPVS